MTRNAERDDLEERVADLERTLEELRRELRPRRGPFGLPRPPRPDELLRFTEQYAVPTAIAVLEVQLRMLEGFRAVLRAMDRGRTASQQADRTRDRAESLGRETVNALDRALSDLGTAIESGGLPDSSDARELLSDAERLTNEIEAELRESRDSTRRRRDTEAIEEEIEILRDEVGDDDSGDGDSSDGDEPPP